jgi:hypothetical protein
VEILEASYFEHANGGVEGAYNGAAVVGRNGTPIQISQKVDDLIVIFEKETKLARIKESCLVCGAFRSLFLPGSVQFIGRSRFAFCNRPETIIFDSRLTLTRFEELCFQQGAIKSICIPRSVETL